MQILKRPSPLISLVLIPVMLAGLTSAAQALADGEPVRAALSAAITAIVAALGKVAWDKLTPTADPRDDAGRPLVPVVEDARTDPWTQPDPAGEGV